MSGDWRDQPERGNSLALHVIRWIATRVGRPAARCLLYPISLYFFLTAGRARRQSLRFLRRAGLPRAHPGHVFRHLHTFAAVTLDRVYFMRGETARFDIRMHLDEGVAAHLAAGRSAILVGAHLGSFDALRAVGQAYGDVHLRVLMHHDHNQLITRILEALNPGLAETVIPLGRADTLLRTKEWLDTGGCVALLGDRVFDADSRGRGRAVECEFLGHRALLPAGPVRVAATLQAPVILFFGIYRGGRRYDLYLEWFADRDALLRYRDPAVMQALVQRYAARLEAFSRDAPYNWFNFHDFWQGDDERGT